MVYPFAKFLLLPIPRIWVRSIKGLENIPKIGPALLAANHASFLDPYVIYCYAIPYTGRKIYSVATKSLFKGNRLKRALLSRWMACIPTNGSIKKVVQELKKRNLVLIFPEGTRSYDGKLLKARTGAAAIALLSRVPVIPIGIAGTHEVWPVQRRLPKLGKVVRIRIGAPLYFRRYYGKRPTRAILEQVNRRIMREIAKLAGKKYKW